MPKLYLKTRHRTYIFFCILVLLGYLNASINAETPITPEPTTTPTPTPHYGGGGGGGSTDPTPTPTATPLPINSENIAPITSGWDLTYKDIPPYITNLDYTVTYNGQPTIRVDPHVSGVDVNTAREVNTPWLHVHPGDHIIFRAWVKTEAYTNSAHGDGARIGIDFYGDGIIDTQPHGEKLNSGATSNDYPNWHSCGDYHYVWGLPDPWPYYGPTTFVDTVESEYRVPWGTSEWTMLEWDVIVPSRTYTMRTDGTPVSSCQISGIIAWLDCRDTTDSASAWFANTQLYILSS